MYDHVINQKNKHFRHTSNETNKKRQEAFMSNEQRRLQNEKQLQIMNEKKRLRYEDVIKNHSRLKKSQVCKKFKSFFKNFE